MLSIFNSTIRAGIISYYMDAFKKDFEDIFKNKTFFIPRYQRGYDWKTLNRDTFWNDLNYHIKEEKDFFLGTIILNDYGKKSDLGHLHKNGKDVFDHALVDGQQRFTTIMILLVALRQTMKNRLKEPDVSIERKLNETVSNISLNYLALQDDDYNVLQYRFFGSDYKSKRIKNGFAYFTDPDWNGKFPREKVEVFGSKKPLTMEFKRFRQVYSDFYSKLNEKGTNGENKYNEENLLDIYKKIISSTFIEITVSSDTDAILLFETVNARGKELETSDLLKNHFFAEVSENNWNKLEKDWDNIIENSKDSGGITRLLKYFYVSRKGSGGSSPPSVLYENLKSLGKNNELNLLEKINEFSYFYKAINSDKQDECLNGFDLKLYGISLSNDGKNRRQIFTSIELLNALNVTQTQPMIFSFFYAFKNLCHDGIQTTSAYDQLKKFPGMFLRQLEHFHYVNNGIGERRANDTEILYQDTAKQFFNCDDVTSFKNTLKNLYSELKKQRDGRRTFEENFCNKLYYKSGAAIDRMIFYTFHILERSLRSDLFVDIFPTSDSTNISRDHWADQSDTRDVAYEKIRNGIINDIHPINGESKIDNIGNLVPLDGTINSELGNIPIKTPYEKSQFLLNKTIAYKSPHEFINKYSNRFKTWDSGDIDDRAKDLADSVYDIIENTPANV